MVISDWRIETGHNTESHMTGSLTTCITHRSEYSWPILNECELQDVQRQCLCKGYALKNHMPWQTGEQY